MAFPSFTQLEDAIVEIEYEKYSPLRTITNSWVEAHITEVDEEINLVVAEVSIYLDGELEDTYQGVEYKLSELRELI